MTSTNHAVTGALVAVLVDKPYAVILAFLAHFVMDLVPHFDIKPSSAKKVVELATGIDIVLAVGATLAACAIIFSAGDVALWLVLTCAFACVSPDLVWGWRYYKLGTYKKVISEPMSIFSRWHQKIQWSETRRGIFVEIPWLVGVLALIMKFR